MRRTLLVDLPAVEAGSRLRVCGWVTEHRGNVVRLQDSTGCAEVLLTAGVAPVPAVGDAVEVTGRLADDKSVTAATVLAFTSRHPPAGSVGTDSPHSYLRFRDPNVVELFRTTERAAQVARDYLREHRFVEAATPAIWQATREYGDAELDVRDPLSPDRRGYLLQSPTVPQMLCAIGGLDRSYQFARCFRSEPVPHPLKAYEFTQLNLTAAFTSTAEHQDLLEGLFDALSRELTGVPWSRPFPSLLHEDALRRYGNDVPDMRYSDIASPVVDGGLVGHPRRQVRLVVIPAEGPKCLDPVRDVLRRRLRDDLGVWTCRATDVQRSDGGLDDPGDIAAVAGRWQIQPPFVIVALSAEVEESFVRGLVETLHPLLAGRRPPRFAAAWIDRPPFLDSAPAPAGGHRSRSLFGVRLSTEVEGVEGPGVDAYDLVVNGVELLSGAQMESDRIRFLDNLRLAGVEEPQRQYSYYLEALDRGAPPLHNCSVGWDRALSLLLGITMTEVMVMPKTGDGRCAVSGLPAAGPVST